MSENREKTIVIIGAGISGLTLAWKMSKKKIKTIVLERQNMAGGLASSISHNGYKMDVGPHYVTLPKESEITDEIFELIGKENIIELPNNIFEKFYKTSFNGKLYSGYPPLFEVIFNSGFRFFFKSFCSMLSAKIKSVSKKEKFETAEEYVIFNYGNFLYNIWFKPYLYRRYLDVEPPVKDVKEQFPSPTISKMIGSLRKKSIVKNEKENKNSKEGENIICYFKGGMGSLIDSLILDIEKNGGSVNLGTNVSCISHNNKPKEITYDKNGEGFTIKADVVVYSTPIEITRNWFENIPEIIQKNHPSGIHCIMVFLMIDAERLYDSWVVNFYDSNISFSRIAQQNFLSETVVPEGKSLLSVEIRTTGQNPLWTMDEKSLVEMIQKDLKKSEILNGEKIDGFKILKIKNLYPNSAIKKDKNSRDKIIKIINSYQNEYSSVAESDLRGILAAGGAGNSSISKITHGAGVYNAFLKSTKLSEVISNEC